MAGTILFSSPLSRAAAYLPRCCATIIAALTLAACAATPLRSNVSAADERALFAETNKDIIEFHIKKVSPEQLTFSGLARLSALDSEISVVRNGDQLVLRRGPSVQRFYLPATTDNRDWAALTVKVIAAARALSPDIAATPADRLDEKIIDASLAALDPYSRYARPEIARERRAARDGFAGIGVTLEIQERDVRIASVMPDTPAASAGLLAGDRIVALDGVPVAELAADEVRRQLRGPALTRIQLAVARRGQVDPLEVSVLRAKIVPETVTLREGNGLAWLKVRAFNQQTARSLADLLGQAHRDLGAALHGVVLDLRDNPGGLLDQSIDVAALFLDRGDVVSTIGRNPQSIQHFKLADKRGAETLPMAVLINGGSASASEIVAATLQDSGRAVVIGTSSYGKGTVQTVLRTKNDGELTVTWAQIITPNGYFLNTHGVVPTLCTAGVDTPATAGALLSGNPSPVPAELALPRARLDEAGWRQLRGRCPPGHDKPGIERLVAAKLLGDATLYRTVLASMGSTRVAANP
jgi:carboxyl-terminal processing protease